MLSYQNSCLRDLHIQALLNLFFFLHELEHKSNETFNKLFLLTEITSELSKYLNEQLGVFLNVKQKNEVSKKYKK